MDTLPLQKLALCVKQNPLECEEGHVLVTPSASQGSSYPSVRPRRCLVPQEPGWSPACPAGRPGPAAAWALAGGSGAFPQAERSPSVWKLTGLGIPLSRKNSRVGPATRASSRKALFHVECGAWEPTFLRRVSLWREGNRHSASPSRGRWEAGSATTQRERRERRHVRPHAVWPRSMRLAACPPPVSAV